ncbi:uncharacterized protein [Eurosta solidaginis]|uniref:uncharacterized protein isoform X1 n=1 Tax=Eurosta solidaginis TaxID=178769 RepID=UPI003530CD63
MRDNDGRLWGKFYNDELEIRSLTKADLEKALDILDSSFFLHESVCNACEINLPENTQARAELRELCRITAEDGVSLVAKHVKSGEIVGITFNKIQYIPPKGQESFFIQFRNEHTHSPQARGLMDFMINVDAEKDVFELYKMDALLELMFLATSTKWFHCGVATELTRYTIALARELSQGIGIEEVHSELRAMRPKAVTAIFTSLYSQKAGRSQGFKVINTVPYTRFTYNGVTFDKRINPIHKTSEHVVFLL